jgi:glycosyltransferase involved in cell wall biosynthesis
MNILPPAPSNEPRHPVLQEHLRRAPNLGALQLPLVSVIITNYNYIKYVTHAINSVAYQTYARFECVIVDDSSTDGSYDSIQAYISKLNDDRFRAMKTPKNLGQFAAIRVGLENTTGPFVCCLDADDMLFPDFIEEHVAAHLNSVWSTSVSGSDSCQIAADGEILEGTQWFFKKPNVRYDSPDYVMGTPLYPLFPETEDQHILTSIPRAAQQLYYIPTEQHGYHAATGSCLMFRRPFLEMAGPPFSEKVCADYYYYVLAHGLAGTLIIPRALTYYRVHGANNFNRGMVLGGVNALPNALESINARLHKVMLDKLLESEKEFLSYPRDKYEALVRYLIAKRQRWKYGKRSETVRKALGCKTRVSFALSYHPILRKLGLRKLFKKK